MQSDLSGSFVVLAACLGLSLAGFQDPEDRREISRRVDPFAESQLDITPKIRVHASMDRENRSVDLMWRYDEEEQFGPSIEAALTDEVATRYIPTAVEFAAPDRIVVAGKLGERVVLEVWTLRAPALESLPDGQKILRSRGLASVRVAFESEEWRAGYVRMMLSNRGCAGHTFLMFSESSDLYELDWSTPDGEPEVVLSALDEPLLATAEYDDYSAGDHEDLGYVYGLHAHMRAHEIPTLRLFDSDRDGVLDGHQGYSYEESKTLGLLDTSKWREFRGVALPE